MIELDKQVQYFSEGDDITPVTKVIVNYGYDETGAVLSKTATASVDNGRTVEFTLTHFTDSSQVQTIANNILSSYQNLGYASFTATGAELDPAAELNDGVEVNGTTSVLGAIDFNFGKGIYADIEAQGINEDDDFGYVSSIDKVVSDVREQGASIEVNSNAITTEVARATAEEGRLSSNITQTASEIRGEVSSELFGENGSYGKYFVFDGSGLSIGDRSSNNKITIDGSKMQFIDETGNEAAKITDSKMNITFAHIDNEIELGTGWSLIVQSDGHLSFKGRVTG